MGKRRQEYRLYWVGFSYLLILAIWFGGHNTDTADLLLLHKNPFHLLPDEGRQFLHGSILNILLGNVFGIFTEEKIKFFYLFFQIFAWSTLIFLAQREFKDNSLPFFLFLLSWPLYKITLSWIGKSDTLLLFGYVLVFFLKSYWRLIGAAVLILAHKELGSIIVFFEILHLIKSEERKQLIYLIVGAIVAWLCHLWYLKYALDGQPLDRFKYMAEYFGSFITYFSGHWYLYVIALLGPILLILLVFRAKPDLIFVFCMLACFCLSIVAADTSRIFILALMPAIFHLSKTLIASDFCVYSRQMSAKYYVMPFLVFEVTVDPMHAMRVLGRPMKYLMNLFS